MCIRIVYQKSAFAPSDVAKKRLSWRQSAKFYIISSCIKRWERSLSNKKVLARRLWLVKRVKTWQLVIILIIAAFLAATFLRLNNLGMIERREAVVEADKRGEKKAIMESLTELQRYVSAHMNTDMKQGVYLQYSYERDRDKVVDNASTASN